MKENYYYIIKEMNVKRKERRKKKKKYCVSVTEGKKNQKEDKNGN